MFLALSRAARSAVLDECARDLQQQWGVYQSALRDTPATRVYQARHLSKVLLEALQSRDPLTNHVLGADQLIALVDRLVLQDQEPVARWLIDRAELFRTVHELCSRYKEHVTALLDLAVHSYEACAASAAVSAQLVRHTLSAELDDTHVTHLTRAVTHALDVIARDQSQAVDFMTLFRTQQLDLDTRGLANVAQNSARVLRALVENTEHLSRDQCAQWMAIVAQCAAPVKQHGAAQVRAERVRAVHEEDEDEDAMEIEFTEPVVPPRDHTAELNATQICHALLTERARDQRTVLSILARAVTASTVLDWHTATLTHLVTHLLSHGNAHDTRRVCEEISDTYTALWPVLRQSDEFRRLLRDLTGQAVEHSGQASTGASTELLLHTWLVLTVAHFQLARIDRSALLPDIPLALQTLTRELCASFQVSTELFRPILLADT